RKKKVAAERINSRDSKATKRAARIPVAIAATGPTSGSLTKDVVNYNSLHNRRSPRSPWGEDARGDHRHEGEVVRINARPLYCDPRSLLQKKLSPATSASRSLLVTAPASWISLSIPQNRQPHCVPQPQGGASGREDSSRVAREALSRIHDRVNFNCG